MAEVAPSLSEQYLLPKEEKVLKPIEEAKDESLVSVATSVEEVVAEKQETSVVAEESSKPVESVEVNTQSSDVPSDAAESSAEEPAEETVTATEETTEAVEEQEAENGEASEEAPEVKLEMAPADFRFPTTNQTRHCFTRYIEYHRCIAAKGEDAPECNRFAKYYRSLCPGEWIDRWNEQRENDTFPGPLFTVYT
ncbi:Cytochrome c oxidase subunit 6b-1-like protein [Drosera capensis]